jgi:non-ribosomal peptide synthetase component E (peptide arylation enzyme)
MTLVTDLGTNSGHPILVRLPNSAELETVIYEHYRPGLQMFCLLTASKVEMIFPFYR